MGPRWMKPKTGIGHRRRQKRGGVRANRAYHKNGGGCEKKIPFRQKSQPRFLFACEHANTFLELPAPRSLVRMRTREHLSGASGSPRSCSHANTRAPFWGFQLPEVLFACEHASPFRSFQQPEVLFACEHAGAFLELPTPQVCSHANTQPPFSSFQLPEVLFACEHANTFFWGQRNKMT